MEKIMEEPAGIMTGIQKISTDTVGRKYPKAAGRSGGSDTPSSHMILWSTKAGSWRLLTVTIKGAGY